ncbi:hypothetical protein J7E37_17565 [Bacillus sp. ISL-39]|nr:hypothetical protein [Bacillus sp. ISL-39]
MIAPDKDVQDSLKIIAGFTACNKYIYKVVCKYEPTLDDLYKIEAVLGMKSSGIVLEIEQEMNLP